MPQFHLPCGLRAAVPSSVRTFFAPAVGGVSFGKAPGKDNACTLGKDIGTATPFDVGIRRATTAGPSLGGPLRPSA